MINIDLRKGNCIGIMSNLEDRSIDLVLTDPPYNIGEFAKERGAQIHTMRPNTFYNKGWDNQDTDDWRQLMDGFSELMSEKVKIGGGVIIFASLLKIGDIKNIVEKHGFYYKTTGIWHKSNPMPRNMNLSFVLSTEAWLYFVNQKRTGTFNNNGKAVHDYVETSVTPLNERKFGKHPTAKPVKLMNHFVRLLSNEGETVLDPFMGSGTTGVSCCELGRNFIGIEKDDKYFEIAKNRIEEVKRNGSQMSVL